MNEKHAIPLRASRGATRRPSRRDRHQQRGASTTPSFARPVTNIHILRTPQDQSPSEEAVTSHSDELQHSKTPQASAYGFGTSSFSAVAVGGRVAEFSATSSRVLLAAAAMSITAEAAIVR